MFSKALRIRHHTHAHADYSWQLFQWLSSMVE